MPTPPEWFDPQYVQISRKEAATILGRSPAEFDRLRESDSECPKGFKNGTSAMTPLRFRLSDVYRYSETLMQRAEKRSA